MVSEKVAAEIEAVGALMMGRSPDEIIQLYREHVAANALRLAAGYGVNLRSSSMPTCS